MRARRRLNFCERGINPSEKSAVPKSVLGLKSWSDRKDPIASFFQSDEAAAKVSLATVYQKHSSLLTRKRMYRG